MIQQKQVLLRTDFIDQQRNMMPVRSLNNAMVNLHLLHVPETSPSEHDASRIPGWAGLALVVQIQGIHKEAANVSRLITVRWKRN